MPCIRNTKNNWITKNSSKLVGREVNEGSKSSLIGEVIHIMKIMVIFNENLPVPGDIFGTLQYVNVSETVCLLLEC